VKWKFYQTTHNNTNLTATNIKVGVVVGGLIKAE
jgi:hypothetical protein